MATRLRQTLRGRSHSPRSTTRPIQKIWLAMKIRSKAQEEAQLVRMYDVEGSRSKDQHQNDRAPMGDYALAKSGETHHPRHPPGDTVHRPGNWAFEPTRRAHCSCSFREMSFHELTVELSAFDASLRMRGAIARG